jgi:hypothetical protein
MIHVAAFLSLIIAGGQPAKEVSWILLRRQVGK